MITFNLTCGYYVVPSKPNEVLIHATHTALKVFFSFFFLPASPKISYVRAVVYFHFCIQKLFLTMYLSSQCWAEAATVSGPSTAEEVSYLNPG